MSRERDTEARNNDAARAVRFLAVKAAVFILVPLLASVVAVLVLLR